MMTFTKIVCLSILSYEYFLSKHMQIENSKIGLHIINMIVLQPNIMKFYSLTNYGIPCTPSLKLTERSEVLLLTLSILSVWKSDDHGHTPLLIVHATWNQHKLLGKKAKQCMCKDSLNFPLFSKWLTFVGLFCSTALTNCHEIIWNQRNWFKGKANLMFKDLLFISCFKMTVILWYFHTVAVKCLDRFFLN